MSVDEVCADKAKKILFDYSLLNFLQDRRQLLFSFEIILSS